MSTPFRASDLRVVRRAIPWPIAQGASVYLNSGSPLGFVLSAGVDEATVHWAGCEGTQTLPKACLTPIEHWGWWSDARA